jgi:hypothetical protein
MVSKALWTTPRTTNDGFARGGENAGNSCDKTGQPLDSITDRRTAEMGNMNSILIACHSNSILFLNYCPHQRLPFELIVFRALGIVHVSNTAEQFRDIVMCSSEVVSVGHHLSTLQHLVAQFLWHFPEDPLRRACASSQSQNGVS